MITDIRLQNFRSYKDEALELGRGVNIIVGPNASGKTNLLEALLVLARGSSYRAKPAELISFNKSWARLDAHTVDGNTRTAKLKNGDKTTTKSFDIGGNTMSRLPLNKTIPVVLFEPHHLLMLTGRPELRRDFLDDLLEQTNPGFAKLRRDYKRALVQRNSLLKKGLQTSGQLFAWNIRLSELGGDIADGRRQLVDSLNEQIDKLYKKLSRSKVTVVLKYESPISDKNYRSEILHMLELNTELDYRRGFTSYGPHREDMLVTINGRSTQDTASRGEARTILLALKILELDLLEHRRGQKPMLLLDDVFSELDGARRSALTNYLKDYQTFITTTDADLVIHNFAQKCTIIPLTR